MENHFWFCLRAIMVCRDVDVRCFKVFTLGQADIEDKGAASMKMGLIEAAGRFKGLFCCCNRLVGMPIIRSTRNSGREEAGFVPTIELGLNSIG